MTTKKFLILLIVFASLAACSSSKSVSDTAEPLSSAEIAAISEFNAALQDQ